MKSFLAIIAFFAFLAIVSAVQYSEQEYQDMFTSFLAKHERTYAANDVEFHKRFNIFKENVQRAAAIGKMDPGAQYGVTKFSDLTPQEFRNMYLMPKKTPEEMRSALKSVSNVQTYQPKQVKDIPDHFNWADKGAVSPVKNQGMCGSCWAFSTTGNVESVNFLKTGQMTLLSEQALVDCDHTCAPDSPRDCNAGCNGGLMELSMMYIAKNGLPTEQSYPYTARDGTCKYNKGNTTAVEITGHVMGPENGDIDVIAQMLMDHGALSVAINAEYLQFYLGGISDPWLCDPKSLDHGVLIQGLGVGKNMFGSTVKYWIVKNSWGSSWGVSGTFMINRAKCGINTYVVSALMK